MSRPDQRLTDISDYVIQDSLDQLLRRLHPGKVVDGRIVDVLDQNRYLLRIWGYNILTESEQKFERREEVKLTVKQVHPHLVLDIQHNNSGANRPQIDGNATDIVI